MSRENVALTNDDDRLFRDAVGLGCALEAFAEADEVAEWVEAVPKEAQDQYAFEKHRQKFVTVLDRYQEQPHLLDPYLPELFSQLLVMIRGGDGDGSDAVSAERTRNAAAAFAAHLAKVRKAKVVTRHFPHEVKDVEPVVTLLENQDSKSLDNWETQYVLLLWMSMLVLIPFDLGRFDSGAVDEDGKEKRKPLMERTLGIVKAYLVTGNKSQDAAALLAAKFLTRPEIQQRYLASFLSWSTSVLADDNSCDATRMGVLKALAAIHKLGKRVDLLQHAETLLDQLLERNLKANPNVLLRKLSLKVVQRLGLTFLKAKVASWRYKRGNRSLVVNLGSGDSVKIVPAKEIKVESNVDEEEDYDVPEEIEKVIEELLCGLRDKETIIRWSAAKGIGRITGRLPKELADEVLESLMQLFSLRETDAAWHGGCLALAELGRRGLLLPQRLPEVVQVVLRALVYDERKGSFSVGAHIRDAACYVCWSFARAYDPDVLKPVVDQVANALVVVTVFDREVNCRRAASAAFQENVGRQGTFPHGIDILTKTDYFAVGSRINTFLKISVEIATYEEYTESLIGHLLDKKVGHWDIAVREITASALHNLTGVAPQKAFELILPRLLEGATKSPDLFMKHGSIVAIGFVVSALAKVAEKEGKKDLREYLGTSVVFEIQEIAVILIQKLAMRSTGGDLLRQAVTTYIDQCSQAHFPVHGEDVVELWQTIIDDNLAHPDPLVQDKAVQAFPNFLGEYLRDRGTGELLRERRDNLLKAYLTEIDTSELHRRGIALALGSMPTFALEHRVSDILNKLMACLRNVTKDNEKWAEGRRDVVLAATNIIKAVGIKREQDSLSISHQMAVDVLNCFLSCLDDYTLDRRGDIGAWVREASMQGLTDIILVVARQDQSLVPEAIVRDLMPRLAQQASEKIDRTRGLAAKLFHRLLFSNVEIPGIPQVKEARACFPSDPPLNPATFQWKSESETFPLFCSLLLLDSYRSRVLLGLTVSMGGLTERLIKHSSASLFAQLRLMDRLKLDVFAQTVLDIFQDNQKNDRIIIPLLKFLDQLLTSGFVDPILEDPSATFPSKLLALLKTEIQRCGEPNKLMLSTDLLCALLQVADETTVKKVLTQLAIFLCHKFPRIRKVTAGKLFEAILTYSDSNFVSEENLDEVNTILSDTKWEAPMTEDLRAERNKLCKLMGIQPPAVVRKVVS